MEIKSTIKLSDGLFHLADGDTRDKAFTDTLCGQTIQYSYVSHYEPVDCPECLRAWYGEETEASE